MAQLENLAEELVKDTVDMHVHSGPALMPRAFDHVEVVRACAGSGMRAIVIKDQHVPSGNVCQIIQKYFVGQHQNFNVYGGLILGNTQGGLSPSVLEAALGYDTKVVWMPVLSAQYSKERMKYLEEHYPEFRKTKKGHPVIANDPPMKITDENGKLLPEISTICKMIADSNIVLATGHLSIAETDLLLEEAVKQGVKKVVITHPEFFREYTLDQMRSYARAGFYVEYVLTSVFSGKGTYDQLFQLVKNSGADHTVISSDLGQIGRPMPDAAFSEFIKEMLSRGMTQEDLRKITSTNGKMLLGIS